MEIKPGIETFASIKVVGVGGGGGASINRMIKSKIRGVHFIAIDDDIQALSNSAAPQKIHMGKSLTRGLGAGMDPEVGKKAAQESEQEIRDALKSSDMVFITCGLGGGTGSGAAPVVAEMAKELGALTVAVVTKPFGFEGSARRKIADSAYEQLASRVDTIIVLPNDRVLSAVDKKTTILEAFERVDDILRQGVQGISELITVPGQINVDFADVRTIMRNAGTALMGIGVGSGESRAIDAAKMAISSPLLDVSIDGAKGILFTVACDASLTMHEVNEAAKIITEMADPNAKIIFGFTINENLKDELRITVVATGFVDREKQEKHTSPILKKESFTAPRMATKMPNVFGKKEVAPMTSLDLSAEGEVVAPPIRPMIQEVPEVKRMMATETQETVPEIPVMRQSQPKMDLQTIMNQPVSTDDLEIPAFIRRKMM